MSTFFRDIIQDLKKVYSLDIRALALMRFGIGLVLLIDLIIRATDLEVHYTDFGVLPLSVFYNHGLNDLNICFHSIHGSNLFQIGLFILAGIFYLGVLVGWKTRWSTFLSWLFLLSLQNRNPLIFQGGDDLLRMMLFWGIFLPWGDRYSIDATTNPVQKNNSYFGAAGIAYFLLIFALYSFSATLKNSAEWTQDGTAIYYALSLDQLTMPLGKLIYPYPELLKFLTFMVYYIELIVPFFFFIPVYNSYFRIAGIVVLTCLHIGIGLTLFVGLFFIIGITTLIGFLPESVMEIVDKKLSRFFPLKTEEPSIPLSKPITFLRYTKEAILGLLLSYSFYSNVDQLQLNKLGLNRIGYFLKINQSWGMFAPAVFKEDGWYIYEASTEHNRLIDLNNEGKPVTYTKPEDVLALQKNDRWRKYSENYLSIHNNSYRPFFCNYLLTKWNNEHQKSKIKDLKIIYMKEFSQPNYGYAKPTREVLCECR